MDGGRLLYDRTDTVCFDDTPYEEHDCCGGRNHRLEYKEVATFFQKGGEM